MVHCFLTGVQFDMDKAYVLNRRDARDLLAALSDRLVSLRRLIAQFGPLDERDEPDQDRRQPHGGAASRKRHRLVCKAVADAMAPGFPEIELFQTWPSHQAHARTLMRQGLHAHPVYGVVIKELNDKAVSDGERLGRATLRQLDPQTQLPRRTRLAVCAAACLQLRGQQPEQAAGLIRSSMASAADLALLGLSMRDGLAIKGILAGNATTTKTGPAESAAGGQP